MNVKYHPMWSRWISRSIIASLMLSIYAACGASGSPIAPEDVGLKAKILQQQQEQQQSPSQPGGGAVYPIPLEEEPVQLPALHPRGTR